MKNYEANGGHETNGEPEKNDVECLKDEPMNC